MDKQLKTVVLFSWGFCLLLITIVFVYSSSSLRLTSKKHVDSYLIAANVSFRAIGLHDPSRNTTNAMPLPDTTFTSFTRNKKDKRPPRNGSAFVQLKNETIISVTNNHHQKNATLATYEHQHGETGGLDCEKGMPDLDNLWSQLVIVTGFSDNHAVEGMGMIASAQKRMPQQRIIVYDLGLDNETSLQLRRLCNVEVRAFDFTKYPPHVAALGNFAWKVIIVKETLFEFGAIFYGDSSVRFKLSLRTLFPYLHIHHGFMFHILSHDANASRTAPEKGGKTLMEMTSPKMFQQLGVDLDEFKASLNGSIHISGGRLLLVNNSVIYTKVLKPLFECSMKKECISPVGARKKNHHYDQSALSILLSNNMRHEWNLENRANSTDQFDKVVAIHHVQTSKKDQLKYCS